ncbi:hypothetical protein Q3G72_012601 [Acer saccharum]|nr:hypothetical protein Q3G72_012601 [Acer saccharum]
MLCLSESAVVLSSPTLTVAARCRCHRPVAADRYKFRQIIETKLHGYCYVFSLDVFVSECLLSKFAV